MRTSIRGIRHLTFVIVVWLLSPAAAAQPSISEKATARSLFEQGRALVQEGKLELACPKLKESYQLDPGAGVAFHLADCYERIGRLASAWALYLEVAVLTRDAGEKEKEAAARRRAAALVPRLSRLTIEVPAAHAVEGLTIQRDGEAVGKGSWNTALPLDPGEHTVTGSAPGRVPWSANVVIRQGDAASTITVPALARVNPEPSGTMTATQVEPAPREVHHEDRGASHFTGQRATGLLVAGGGVLALGLGTYLGLRAKSSYDDSSPYCDGDTCSQTGLDIRADARRDAGVATVVGGVGLAAIVGGATLYLVAPGDTRASTDGDVGVGIGPGSVLIRGAWSW